MDASLNDDPGPESLPGGPAGWPRSREVGKAGFKVGGPRGPGEIYDRGQQDGNTDFTEGTLGLQAAAHCLDEPVIFLFMADLDRREGGMLRLGADTSAVAHGPRAAPTTGLRKGAFAFVHTTAGSWRRRPPGGQVFRFGPL